MMKFNLGERVQVKVPIPNEPDVLILVTVEVASFKIEGCFPCEKKYFCEGYDEEHSVEVFEWFREEDIVGFSKKQKYEEI